MYNFTNITAGEGTLGTFVCEINHLSNFWVGYVIIFLIFAIMFTYFLQKGYTIYTSLLPPSFTCALLSTIFWAVSCTSGGMQSGWIAAVFWVLTGLFAAIRKAIGE